MSLVTPDFGLLFWMVVIFGVVFFILAKFGFPVITTMIDKRGEKIAKSLQDAKEIEVRLANTSQECLDMLEKARKEHNTMLNDASRERKRILEEARDEARAETEKLLAEARGRIAAEREAALEEARKDVAELAVGIAEQILRRELEKKGAQMEFAEKMVEEASRAGAVS